MAVDEPLEPNASPIILPPQTSQVRELPLPPFLFQSFPRLRIAYDYEQEEEFRDSTDDLSSNYY